MQALGRLDGGEQTHGMGAEVKPFFDGVGGDVEHRVTGAAGPMTERLRADDARRCATLRRELLDVASGVDRAYPRDEATAAVDMMLGTGLLRLTDPSRAEASEPTVVDDTERVRSLRHDSITTFGIERINFWRSSTLSRGTPSSPM